MMPWLIDGLFVCSHGGRSTARSGNAPHAHDAHGARHAAGPQGILCARPAGPAGQKAIRRQPVQHAVLTLDHVDVEF